MKKILKKAAIYVRRNAIEGAGAPSFKGMYELKVPKGIFNSNKEYEKN